ncbi:MAG: hypothetical protein FJ117_01275 [Deltaproteobacteria bacterium]|nr:hypothetical protein [Deltaproteobacteria bacterium]
MKKVLFIVFIVTALFTWVLNGPTMATDPVVTWRVQIPFSPGFWHHKAAQLWAEDITKMTEGRMKIDLRFPVFDLYPEVISTVQSGQLDAGYTWLGWAWGFPPGALVLKKYPAAIFFAGTPAFLDLLGYYTWMNAYGGKELLQEVFGNTLIVMPAGMFWAKTGGWSSKKIESLSDMKGQKVRTADAIWGKILSKDNSEKFIAQNFLGYSFLHSAFTADYDLSGKKLKLFVIEGAEQKDCRNMVQAYLQRTGNSQIKLAEGRFTLKGPYHGEMDFYWKGKYIWGALNLDDSALRFKYISLFGESLERK